MVVSHMGIQMPASSLWCGISCRRETREVPDCELQAAVRAYPKKSVDLYSFL